MIHGKWEALVSWGKINAHGNELRARLNGKVQDEIGLETYWGFGAGLLKERMMTDWRKNVYCKHKY